MAEQIVFGADIDNVTIKVVDNKLTAVGGSNTENEFEVVTNYVDPVEDDEFYIESTEAKILHKPTQLLVNAYKKEKKPRSAPVNERLDREITATVSTYGEIINVMVDTGAIGNPISQVDGKVLAYFDYNSANTSVELNKNDYASAKAFNEANAGKTFTVTTAKRYATSEGHPVVRPTEIQVSYPKLPYTEENLTTTPDHDKHYIYSYVDRPGFISSENSAIYGQYFNDLQSSGKLQIQAHYKLTLEDNRVIEGDHTFHETELNREEIPDYADNIGNIVSQEWTFNPITVQGFYGKFVVTPGVYTQ